MATTTSVRTVGGRLALALVPLWLGAAGCQDVGDLITADVAERVAYLRGTSHEQADTADYGVDVFGHVETGAGMRSRPLPLEPMRGTPYQQFRVLMDGRERRAFDEFHWEPAAAPDAPEGDLVLVDRRERFLRHHGTRLKWALLDAGVKPGQTQDEAEALVTGVVGGDVAWRDSDHEDIPSLRDGGAIDYSHEIIERVAWATWNGYGTTHVWLHFRNGRLERWEVHAESN